MVQMRTFLLLGFLLHQVIQYQSLDSQANCISVNSQSSNPFYIIKMHTLTLRLSHHADDSLSLAYMILFYIVSYVILLISVFFFYQGFLYTSRKSDIYPQPSSWAHKVIGVIFLIADGVVGAYSTYLNVWSLQSWIIYAVVNILIAVYLLIYHSQTRYYLMFATLFIIAIAVGGHWLFIGINHSDDTVSNNALHALLGLEVSFFIVQGLLTIGHFLLDGAGFSKKCQAVFFFIILVGLLGGLGYWYKSSILSWVQMSGYMVGGAVLLVVCAIQTRNNYKLDLPNLIL